jgi:hypothetical protein
MEENGSEGLKYLHHYSNCGFVRNIIRIQEDEVIIINVMQMTRLGFGTTRRAEAY